jgi:molecular chaperone GrpE|tara:strand:- start:537 stop:1025 length:489 start_codon:yes stop_codon:yes gene_type:complete
MSKSKTVKKPTLKSQIEELNISVKEEKDKFLRLFAEFENYKKRTSKERLELYKTASQELMTALLPVIDDMDRASLEFSKSKEKGLVEGFSLIKNKTSEILKSQGLIIIEVKKGDEFDAEIHEAITQIPAQEKKMKGKVIDIIEFGYKLGEKIIRYPKVVVGK